MMRDVIKPLPETVKSSVRSGVVVFDLTRVVEELIYNSLDAGASKVSVAVAVGTGYIKVTDNGCGITRDGLVLLGERYATSKSDELADMDTTTGSFGFRGEALGSIADVSLLEVVTKAHGRPNGYRKVMKGCKCLYLGIDDNRHDVGTTVTIQDLFYNQPVRRKQLQSSPRKVLHILKECVLKIALIHLKVSINVFDMESEVELLCTHPSSSPLPLLMSGLGLDPSISLHEFDVSDGTLKISGYISGPCETIGGKAVQYVYINSRFVGKGPIHKLLSQLAAKFDNLGLCGDNNGFSNGKRFKMQNNPSYILNLGCPSSLYNLTFEPSKTSAEFKDLDLILTFLEKAITKIWNRYMSYGHGFGDDALRVDNTWNEGDYSVTTEDTAPQFEKKRKRCKTHFSQAALDVPLPQPKIVTMSFNELSPCRSNKISGLNLSRTTSEIEKQQSKMTFSCQNNFSTQLCGVFSPCREAEDQENGCRLEVTDGNIYLAEDHLLGNKFTTDTSNEHRDPLIDTRCNSMTLTVDADMTDILTANGSSALCFEESNDVEEMCQTLNKDKYFLKSCSLRRGPLHGRALSVSNKGVEYNAFENQEQSVYGAGSIDFGVVNDSNQILESWQDERDSIWFSPRLTNEDIFIGSDTAARDQVHLSRTGDCFEKDDDLPLDLSKQSRKYGSRQSFSKFNWPCMTPDTSAKTKLLEADQIFDKIAHDDCKIATNQYSGDKEEKGWISGLDTMGNNFSLLNCYASSHVEDSGRHDYTRSPQDICYFNIDDLDSNSSPNFLDIYSDEAKRLCPKPSGRDIGRSGDASSPRVLLTNDVDKDRRSQIRNCEKAYETRPRRSHSAPPFYRGKKKFSVVNSFSNMEPQGTQVVRTHDNTSKGTCVMEPDKQSFDAYHPSSNLHYLNDSLDNTGPNARTADLNKVRSCDMQAGSPHLLAKMHFEDCTESTPRKSLETKDSLVTGTKWRSSSQLSTKRENSINPYNKDANILDVSSGILHLAGDTLVPKSFTKDSLNDAKVLQQVDRKYIPVVGCGILAIIDQHAADERIRLEELRSKVLAGEMKTVTYLDVEQELVLPELGHQLLQNYAQIIRNWGWICSINIQSSRSFKKNLKLLHNQSSVATLIAVPCILGVNLTDADLLEFLQQLSDTDGSSAVPPSVLRVLNYKACRGAIMFGDLLLPSECSLIVEELKQTSLCFQCAHGRPTTAPLVNLKVLHKQIPRLGLGSSLNESWQGLHRHEVSLERAVQRLKAASGH